MMRPVYSKLMKITSLSSLLLLAACSEPDFSDDALADPALNDQGEEPTIQTRFTSSNGCYEIETDLLEKANMGNMFSFDIQIVNACVELAGVRVEKFYADMPGHGHGMNTRAVVARQTVKHYQVNGVMFHMPGHWVNTIEIINNDTVEVIQIDVQL